MKSFNRVLVLNLILSCALPSFATRVNQKAKQKKNLSMLADDAVVVEKAISDVDTLALEFRPATAVTNNGCKCKGRCGTSGLKAVGSVVGQTILKKTGFSKIANKTGISKVLGKGRELLDKMGLGSDKKVCDWCRTEGCDHKWGYCKYEKYGPFDGLDHDQKTEKLWSAIIATQGKSAEVPNIPQFLGNMLSVSMRTPFDDWYDVLPAGRKKAIHTQAVHCKINFAVDEDGYTGIFAKGSTTGIIRMGSAAPMGLKKGNMVPGLGFKFPRSQLHSGSFVALTDEAVVKDSRDFLAHEFANHANPPDNEMLVAKFGQASGCLNMVGLSDLAKHKQEGGETIQSPKFPFELIFRPAETVIGKATIGPDAVDADILTALERLQDGDDLFEVFAYASPQAKDAEPTKLGKITLASECHASLFGDTALFIRHQRMEEDFALEPDWLTFLEGKGIANDCLSKFTTDGSEWEQPSACKGELGSEDDEDEEPQ